VLTAQDANGQRQFKTEDAAVLFYLSLVRLSRTATFVEALQAMVDVAMTMFAGDLAGRDQRVQSIRDAYAAVGIE
jgi:Zn-dependent metalloprotease